jgi:hypothetical protein
MPEHVSRLVARDRDVPKGCTQVIRGDRMAGFMDGDLRKTPVVHRRGGSIPPLSRRSAASCRPCRSVTRCTCLISPSSRSATGGNELVPRAPLWLTETDDWHSTAAPRMSCRPICGSKRRRQLSRRLLSDAPEHGRSRRHRVDGVVDAAPSGHRPTSAPRRMKQAGCGGPPCLHYARRAAAAKRRNAGESTSAGETLCI